MNFARDNGLLLAVRGGGHNIAGNALCDDGIVIDLSQMKAARVDPGARRVTIEGGATLADLDAATQAHGLATPVGINSTTGIAGLTLGGGFGWLSRKYGMTIDNLESAEVVTAAGEVVRASATEHPDLFWALRGGGGNFGVVTRFEFRLHPVGPERAERAHRLPDRAGEVGAAAVPRIHGEGAGRALRVGRPAPGAAAAVPPARRCTARGSSCSRCSTRAIRSRASRSSRRCASSAPLVGEHVGVQPYTAWQQAFDPLLTAGARNYWKSHNFSKLDDRLFDAVIEYIGKLPSPQCEIFFGALGGATTRPAPDSAAYAHRDARFVMNVHGRWDDPADDERGIRWSRDFFKASAPFASGGVYVNFLTADEGDRVRSRLRPELRSPRPGEAQVRPGQPVPREPEHQAGLRDGDEPTHATNFLKRTILEPGRTGARH